MRRAVDVVVAGAVLVMVSPLLLLVAVAVRLTSRGPAIFRQERVGRGGAPFHILKFRTMRSGETGPGLAVADDARVTALGTVLRRHRLDELPQLVNVVRGEMSLVGPRPEVPRFARTRGEEQARVLESVRPGMTGPTTVAFAHEAQLLRGQADPERYYLDVLLPLKTRLDVEYVDTRTLRGDLRVLWRTLGVLARPRRRWGPASEEVTRLGS